MQEDQKTIKELMLEFIDLDGKNANFRIEHKSNIYAIILYLLHIGVIIFFLLRFSLSSEPSPNETFILILAILSLIGTFWKNIKKWTESSAIKAGGATTTFISDLLN